MADPASQTTSLEIPGYRVVKELGEGGMARVYLAVQESLDREVAIKVMSTELVSDPEFCQRFLKEGRTLAKVTHPHVLTIYDSGEHEGLFYMCMELVRGGSLEDRINEEKLDLRWSVEIIKQVASALEWSHGKGLVHRDIKPANVLFRDDRTAVLSDFGIAKAVSKDATRLTAAGLAIGTPTYMSPEQASARELTPASDQYSLGVMFYEMLTGNVPFDADTGFTIALQHLQAPVPKLPEEHADLQPIIERMMAKDPNDRFHTLEEMTVALERTVGGQDTLNRRTEVIKGPVRTPARPGRPVILAGIGALAALLLLGGVYVVMEQGLLSPEKTGSRTASAPAPETGATAEPEPAPPGRGLDPETREEVEKWLDIAQTHFDIGRLTTPPGNNAMYAYEKALEVDPENARAREGMSRIAQTYENVARETLQEGNVSETRELLDEALKLFPDNQGLVALREELPEG